MQEHMFKKLPVETALDLRVLGIAAIPIQPGSKQPACKWRTYQYQCPGYNEILSLFRAPNLNVGAVGGAASQGLVVCDCDDWPTLEALDKALSTPCTMVVQSRRGGHLYFRLPLPVRSTVHPVNPALQINAQGKYVLAAGSLHPSGFVYSYLREADSVVESDDYNIIPDLRLIPIFRVATALVPPQVLRLLMDPDLDRYASRSEVDCAVCAIMVRKGFSRKEVLSLYQRFCQHNSDSKYAEIYHDRGELGAIQYLERTYDKAAEFLKSHPHSADQLHAEMFDLATSVPWPGRGGQYDKAALLAHLQIMKSCCKAHYSASIRELAEKSGMSLTATSHANERLQKLGVLVLEREANTLEARNWTLSLAQMQHLLRERTYSHTATICDSMSVDATTLPKCDHDAFRGRGGKTVYDADSVLWHHDQGLSASQIATVTGRHKSTICRILPQMHRIGVVNVSNGIWVLNRATSLDDIAHKLGHTGKGLRQRKIHARQRAQHRKNLVRSAQKTNPEAKFADPAMSIQLCGNDADALCHQNTCGILLSNSIQEFQTP